MLSWIVSRLIGRPLTAAVDVDIMAVPTTANETGPIISPCEPDPIPPIGIQHCTRFKLFVSVPITTWPYSVARSNPLIPMAIGIPDSTVLIIIEHADICIARKDFVIVNQLS